MATNLITVEARSKLAVRRTPYWHQLSSGCQVGFRKMSAATAGRWVAQVNTPEKGQVRRPLGSFDEIPPSQRFDAAKRATEALRSHLLGGGSADEVTVRQACERYVKHLKAEGKAASANDADGRFARLVYNDRLADLILRKLTTNHIRTWRQKLAGRPVVINPCANLKRTRDRSPASVNRDMTSLRAALNLARENGATDTDGPWRVGLRPMEAAGTNRKDYIDKLQRASLIELAEKDSALYMRGLSLLPLRPGTLAKLTVGHLDKRLAVLTIGADKGGHARNIQLPQKTAEVFIGAAGDRKSDEPLFARADGTAWNKDSWKKPIKAAVAAANLPATVSAYTFRHSLITDMIVAGVDLLTVARLAGTSLQMIEKHYGHLVAKHATAALANLEL